MKKLLAVMVVLTVLGAVFVGMLGAFAVEYELITVRVEKGDSLWSLAREYMNQDGSRRTRECIKEIMLTNHLDSKVIRPGQIISVPVKKEVE